MLSDPNHPSSGMTPADYEARHHFPQGGQWTEALPPRSIVQGPADVCSLMGPGISPALYHTVAPAAATTYYQNRVFQAGHSQMICQALPQAPAQALPPVLPPAPSQSHTGMFNQLDHQPQYH